MEKCVPNTSSVEICQLGDKRLLEETSKVFKKEKNMKKGTSNECNKIKLKNNISMLFLTTGISFPTCVSSNNCICHFSPLKSDPDYLIKDGDLVKM